MFALKVCERAGRTCTTLAFLSGGGPSGASIVSLDARLGVILSGVPRSPSSAKGKLPLCTHMPGTCHVEDAALAQK